MFKVQVLIWMNNLMSYFVELYLFPVFGLLFTTSAYVFMGRVVFLGGVGFVFIDVEFLVTFLFLFIFPIITMVTKNTITTKEIWAKVKWNVDVDFSTIGNRS